MLKLIKFLFTGEWCSHNWKVIKAWRNLYMGKEDGFYYDLQCQKCGNIKTIET